MNAGEFIAENKSFMVFRMDFFFFKIGLFREYAKYI